MTIPQAHITDSMRKSLADAFTKHQICRTQSMPFSAAAFLAWEMRTAFLSSVVLITDSLKTMDEMHRNVTAFANGHETSALCYPAWSIAPDEHTVPKTEITGDRLNTLSRLARIKKKLNGTDIVLVVTCIQALMQMTLAPDMLKRSTIHLALKGENDIDTFCKSIK